MGDPGAVVLVSWQVSAEIALLIGESPDDHSQEKGQEGEYPQGPQSHWHSNQQQETCAIQGVTDQRIESS